MPNRHAIDRMQSRASHEVHKIATAQKTPHKRAHSRKKPQRAVTTANTTLIGTTRDSEDPNTTIGTSAQGLRLYERYFRASHFLLFCNHIVFVVLDR